MLKRVSLGALAACMLPLSTWAKPLDIVGSSTVYPFSKYVASQLSGQGQIAPPHFQVTGSGGGIKLFCASDAPASPDITNASRRMKNSELASCHRHGVRVSELMIGYDGIALVQGKSAWPIHLSRKDLFLAMAKQVPAKDGVHLIPNPYHYWNEINADFPHRAIRIFGPPETAGTRSILEKKLMDAVSLNIPAYTQAGYGDYHMIREDGVFISDGEDHEKVIPILQHDADALAFFGYGIYAAHRQDLVLNQIDGYDLTPENVTSMKYPLSRPLYFYVKRSHMKGNQDMERYVQTMMSERMIGDQGECVQRGLIPLQGSVRNAYRLWLKYDLELSEKNLMITPGAM